MFMLLALLWKLVVCLASNYHALVSNVFYYSGGFMECWPFSILAGIMVAKFLVISVFFLIGVPFFLFYGIRYLFYMHPALLFIAAYQAGSILFSVSMGSPFFIDGDSELFVQSSGLTDPSLSSLSLQEGSVEESVSPYRLSLWIYPVFIVGVCVTSYLGWSLGF